MGFGLILQHHIDVVAHEGIGRYIDRVNLGPALHALLDPFTEIGVINIGEDVIAA